MQSSNDISYDGVEADAVLSYNSTFGKICTGEQFRVLFTIQNQNTQFSLDNIKMKVIIQRTNVAQGTNAKPKDDILMSETLKTLAPKS